MFLLLPKLVKEGNNGVIAMTRTNQRMPLALLVSLVPGYCSISPHLFLRSENYAFDQPYLGPAVPRWFVLSGILQADQFKKIHDFARAYGSLCWNLSKVR